MYLTLIRFHFLLAMPDPVMSTVPSYFLRQLTFNAIARQPSCHLPLTPFILDNQSLPP